MSVSRADWQRFKSAPAAGNCDLSSLSGYSADVDPSPPCGLSLAEPFMKGFAKSRQSTNLRRISHFGGNAAAHLVVFLLKQSVLTRYGGMLNGDQRSLAGLGTGLKSAARMKKEKKNIYASKLARQRWAKVPISERADQVPRSGGRPRKYPKCPRYGSHRFSPRTGRCPCGFSRLSK
jgi:hypothetical protein